MFGKKKPEGNPGVSAPGPQRNPSHHQNLHGGDLAPKLKPGAKPLPAPPQAAPPPTLTGLPRLPQGHSHGTAGQRPFQMGVPEKKKPVVAPPFVSVGAGASAPRAPRGPGATPVDPRNLTGRS